MPPSAQPKEPVRQGELHKPWFRGGRLFQADAQWYISTREGVVVGPFQTRRRAEHHERRIASLLESAATEEEAHRIIHEYNNRPAARL